jgi:RNA polymerase sigma factor (sigma-70 family)
MSPTSPEPQCQSAYVCRLRNGEPRAWEDMTQELTPLLRASIARQLRQPVRSANVEECLQMVWTRVYQFRDKIPDATTDEEARTSLRRWLCRVARNAVINRAKQLQRQGERLPVVSLQAGRGSGREGIDPSDHAPSPPSQVGWRSLYQHIRDELDERDRRIVDLLLDGLTYGQIGEQVGLKAEGVRSRMQEIRIHIRRLLARWGSR